MKREPKILLGKAVDALVLAVEHFNSASDRGREEAVLILLDHAFELFMKATILHRGGKIREPRATETIGFDKCVRKLLTEGSLRCFDDSEALTVQIINGHRDAAQHYMIDLPEQLFYVTVQAGVSLFAKKLDEVFKERLHDRVPKRVLPVTINPPKSFDDLIANEVETIRLLAKPGSRKQLAAMSALRGLSILESSLGGSKTQPSEGELKKTLRKIQQGKKWSDVFPGVASLRLESSGEGFGISLRLTKHEGEAVHLVPEGTEGARVLAVKSVNDFDYFSLTAKSLGAKLGLSQPKTIALIDEFKIRESPEYYKEFVSGAVVLKKYSPKALDFLKKQLPAVDMDDVWKRHKPTGRAKAK